MHRDITLRTSLEVLRGQGPSVLRLSIEIVPAQGTRFLLASLEIACTGTHNFSCDPEIVRADRRSILRATLEILLSQ
jgi:hypothetical protein